MIADAGEQPINGRMLNRIFHDIIVSATGIDPTLVRPAFQFEPPLFDENVNWIAFRSSLSESSHDYYVYAGSDGETVHIVHDEQIKLHVSLYGIDAMANASRFRDCYYVDALWRPAEDIGIRRSGVSDISSAPDLIDEHWIGHYDVEVDLARQVERVYSGIGSISKITGSVDCETLSRDIDV